MRCWTCKVVTWLSRMKKIYNKLVRDRIPEIIKGAGKTPTSRAAAADEIRRLLEGKLQEELDELCESGANRPEELADILEVVLALAAEEGLSPEVVCLETEEGWGAGWI